MCFPDHPFAKLLPITQVHDQFHRSVRQNDIAPARGQIAAHHPEMFDMRRQNRRNRSDTMTQHKQQGDTPPFPPSSGGFDTNHEDTLGRDNSLGIVARMWQPVYSFNAARRCGMSRLVNSTESPAERCDHSGQVKLASSG